MESSRRLVLATAIALPMLWAGVVDANDTVVINAGPSRRFFRTHRFRVWVPLSIRCRPRHVSRRRRYRAGAIPRREAMTREGMINHHHARSGVSASLTRRREVRRERRAVARRRRQRLSTSYPYRTVGKLNFSVGYCSASLIRRSVIVTRRALHPELRDGYCHSSLNFQFRPGRLRSSWCNPRRRSSPLWHVDLDSFGASRDLGKRHGHRHRCGQGQ